MVAISPEILLTLALLGILSALYSYGRGQKWNAALALGLSVLVWVAILLRTSQQPLLMNPVLRVAMILQVVVGLAVVMLRLPAGSLSTVAEANWLDFVPGLLALMMIPTTWLMMSPAYPVYEAQWVLWLALLLYFLRSPGPDLAGLLFLLSWWQALYISLLGAQSSYAQFKLDLPSSLMPLALSGLILWYCVQALRANSGRLRWSVLPFFTGALVLFSMAALSLDWTLPI